MTSPSSTIAIIGAGVFGLTTALHLAQRGYTHVTVYDYQPYHLNAYNPAGGCDAASADVNKIYRCSYGKETEYQDLAFSGRPIWLAWNAQLASTPAHLLPPGLSPSDKLFVPSGFLRISDGEGLSAYDADCLEALKEAGLRGHQHVSVSVFCSVGRCGFGKVPYPLATTLDTSAGFTYADKSCAWARFLAEQAGVKFVLGPEEGKFDELLFGEPSAGGEKKVRGLKTVDGNEHLADVVIVACGGWTPSVVPEVEGLLETTAGSVVTVQLPEDRQDLWDKYAPENFPVWAYGLTGHESPEYGGFYGFPRTQDGKIKIGYRGRKWTNYQVNPKTGKEISTPLTAYTPTPATNLPLRALALIKHIIALALPDLADPSIGIAATRMCWYTDSVDNSFVVDYVPGYGEGLFVASGGSGHGFKFLPVLGKHVVNALEKKPDQFTDMFHWRTAAPDDKYANGLKEDKETSGRDLGSLKMGEKVDWLF
ncbi:hypothetical protein L202_03277 [Cryptococcus amylolentus CBS 6039]|uniref:FAD dependent oxidoreductase domain-containing protein n=2 Tax=Cryptococcus amylolentus TaxID=104669 RepID=A0A1E3HSB9_9TREE|nr:hypothetical protein L202_03277 [Cryptococcus amylolentus CBS 6039]ODN79263.1 hypothetical protein L202_03277 [Cryptococcus amylolentus CBS 6039]ODO07669.1 hypothetical protein I350_03240 [Cryptococcus amylolentus CBS 6273]